MSCPVLVNPLPAVPGLPLCVQLLAEATVYHPASSSDHLLVLADALDEVAQHVDVEPPVATAARMLADDLRCRAPAYA